MSNNTTPVLLLTGYLGSGKTTLLNRILANRKGIRFAVIVNDIGEVNVDADLIQKGGVVGQKDDSLVALQNGCICCTLKMDLVQQLSDIIKMKRFDYIVIEASGICEPAPIAQTICSIPYMEERFHKDGYPVLDCVVTVVDALRMRDEFGGGSALMKDNIDDDDLESLVIQQIEFCNIVLLNKASEVEPEELERIRKIVRAIQPKAEIINCDYGDVDLDKIVGTGLFNFGEVSTSPAWMKAMEEAEEENEEEGEADEYGIGTFVYYRRQPLDLVLFDEFVGKHWPKNVIRAKGICYFADEPAMCYIFEQAGRQMTVSKAGQWYATMPKDEFQRLVDSQPDVLKDWDDVYGDRMQKLVFIGQNLDKDAISSELDKCLRIVKIDD